MPDPKKYWNRDIPIYLNILTLFLVVLFAFASVLIGYNYYQSRKAALQVADDLLDEVSGKVIEHLDRLYEPIFSFVDLTSELPEAKHPPTIAGHPLTRYLMGFMELYPFITSSFIGLENGEFYQVVRFGKNSIQMKNALKAPRSSSWAIQTIVSRPDGKRVRIWGFLDSSRQVMDSRASNKVDYNPGSRSWYQLAQKSSDVIHTPPYVYASSGEVGITVARRFDSKIQGVFGADLSNRSLSQFLKEQKISKQSVLLMYNEKGEILAHPEIDQLKRQQKEDQTNGSLLNFEELNSPFFNHLHTILKSSAIREDGGFRFSYEGERFVGKLWKIPDKYSEGSYFLIAEPENHFTKHVLDTGFRSSLVSIIILIVTIPLVLLISLRVSSPIKLLTDEAREIQQLELNDPILLKSRIFEINQLHEAMGTMKSGLAAFMKYVPSSLVKQLIVSGVAPELGGERREITVLFTDIKDFTTISEKQNPEELMKAISEYFQQMGNEILASKGTIDKYIGDAIMAFWNAPQMLDNHATSACVAALNCRFVSNSLNKEMKKTGHFPFFTRFGIHTGDSIVGNIGTSDRMNYTTMGSSVNLASRLEGLNKQFGTQILISSATKQKVEEDFLFRAIGKIIVKGQSKPHKVYELLGVLPASELEVKAKPVSSKLIQYAEIWEKAFAYYVGRDWEKARDLFVRLKQVRPNDFLANYYHLQSINFQKNPPADNWDAVVRSFTK